MSPAREVACPGCGAPVRFVSAASLLAVCGYCRATLLRRDLDVRQVGTMGALLADPTPVRLGTRGRYRQRPFQVIGRLQVAYEAGLWNEWFLAFDDAATGWLGDGAGTWTVSFERQVPEPLPPWGTLRPGLVVTLAGMAYEVADVRTATVTAGEGELPFLVGSGYAARVADLRTPTARFATLDYSEDPPRVYLGEVVEFAALALEGLREIPGWSR